MSTKFLEIKYKCQDDGCGATDILKVFPDEAVPEYLNCWKCHGGVNKTADEQRILKIGMRTTAGR
jgi:hypothetical protein